MTRVDTALSARANAMSLQACGGEDARSMVGPTMLEVSGVQKGCLPWLSSECHELQDPVFVLPFAAYRCPCA